MASVLAACNQHTLFPLYAIEVKCQVDCWAFRFAVTRCAAEKDVGQQSSPSPAHLHPLCTSPFPL